MTTLKFKVITFCFFTFVFLSNTAYSLENNLITEHSLDLLSTGITPDIHIIPLEPQSKNINDILDQLELTPATSALSPNFGFSDKDYWIGLPLKNDLNSETDIFVEIAYGLLDNIEFYVIDTQTREIIQKHTTGDKLLFSERPIHHPNFVFPVSIDSKQSVTTIIHISTSSSNQFPIRLWSQAGLTNHSQNQALFVGLLIGIVFILAVYNFFLFFSLKDVSYFYLSLTLFGYALVEAIVTGFAYYYFWPGSPEWNDISLTVVSNFSLANLCLFSRSFLSLEITKPTLGKILKYCAVMGYMLAAASLFIPYKILILITAANVILSPSISYVAGMSLALVRYKQAYFYTSAFGIFVISAAVFAIGKTGLIPRNNLSEYAIHIGATLSIVLLSFALADRIKRERNEKESAQKSAIANLEKYRSIYETSLEGMFRFSCDGKILTCNPAFKKLMGIDKKPAFFEDMGNLSGFIPFASKDQEQLKTLLRNNDHAFGFETLCHNFKGEEFWGAIYAKVIEDKQLGRYIDASIVDITEKKTNENKLNYIANHDILTGLKNRLVFQKNLHDAIISSCSKGLDHSLLFMDLDQFKIVNDTCGHSAGDELLKQMAALFNTHIRDIDSLARLGGDEFVILLRECSIGRAEEIANRLRQEVADYRFSWNKKIFSIGISIGIVPVLNQDISAEDLLSLADTACYAAKDAGRNHVYVYENDSEDISSRQTEMHLANSLREAINNDTLLLYKQNIQAISQTVEGDLYEILVRLPLESKLLLPGSFLPAAERFDRIEQLDFWVTEAFLSWLSKNPESLNSLHQANINLSGRTISNSRFSEHLIELFGQYNIPKEKVCFEITESAAISNLAQTSTFLKKMTKMGFQFSLDDFGSGFSSYSYLKMLPVKSLKIDGSFIQDITSDPIDHAMVKSIIEVSHMMGIDVTAEFVENEEILVELQKLGIDFVQGYHIHMPHLIN